MSLPLARRFASVTAIESGAGAVRDLWFNAERAGLTNVQALQKQLSERDKKIDELSSQLEALKRIDQEMREKVRPIRPPSTVVPPTTSEPTNP